MEYTNVEMYWILAKFLKDTLDLLDDSPDEALKMKRGEWVYQWKLENLEAVQMKKWMPKNDNN